MSQGYRYRKPAPHYVTRSLEHTETEMPVDVYMLRHDGFRQAEIRAYNYLISALINEHRATVAARQKVRQGR